MIGPIWLKRNAPIPIAVMDEEGSIVLVEIPRMSEQAFEFFLRQLELFKPAITRRSVLVSNEKPKGSGEEASNDGDD